MTDDRRRALQDLFWDAEIAQLEAAALLARLNQELAIERRSQGKHPKADVLTHIFDRPDE